MRNATWRGAAALFAFAFALCSFLDSVCQAQLAADHGLTWLAEPGCPDRAWAEARLRDRLGPDWDLAAAGLAVRAELRRMAQDFELALFTAHAEQHGERRLAAARCEEVADAAVLVIALAVEERKASPDVAPPAPPPSAEQPSVPATPPKPAQEPDGRPQSSTKQAQLRPFSVRADALLELGFLPHLAVGPQLAAGYVSRFWRAELAGFWLLPQTASSGADGKVRVSLWALRAAGCGRLWEKRARVDACAGFELGRSAGVGSGLAKDEKRTWLYRAAWASARLSTPLYRDLGLVLEPAIGIPLGRPSFVSVDASGTTQATLHTSAVVSGRVTLGTELRF